MIYFLKEDHYSGNRNIYARKGEQVKEISDHDNCIIAEHTDTKIRFGINRNKLSESFIPKEELIENAKDIKRVKRRI